MNNRLQYLLFLFLLAAFFLPMYFLPAVQRQFPAIQAKRLQGSFEETKRPNFWFSRWLDGSYQKGLESYLKDRNPVAPFFVRMKTEADFRWFGDIPHENILMGKQGHFYPKTDCEAYVGKSFIGRSELEAKVNKLDYLIDHYRSKNIPFLILLPPGKPGIYPEWMPDYYRTYPADSTNRNLIRELLTDRGISYIDFDFLANHKKDPYPLYAQASLHWSQYGFALAADSIRSYILHQLGLPMPEFLWKDSIEMRSEPQGMDTELINGANFMWPPKTEPVPNPVFRYRSDSLSQKTRVLSISDSYYLALWDHGLHTNLFAEGSLFLYYNHEVYPPRMRDGKRLKAQELDQLKLIEEADLVILMVYETNLDRFGFGFLEGMEKKLKSE